jgi:hypothetical protein
MLWYKFIGRRSGSGAVNFKVMYLSIKSGLRRGGLKR